MLYDPKWHQPPADIFALESLIAWLERQPGDREYCYVANGRCLIAQYLIYNGHTKVHVDAAGRWRSNEGSDQTIPLWRVSIPQPWTFGAALTRARAALAARDV